LFAFVVQFGEAGADAGAVCLSGGVAGVGGQLFQFDDLGVLRGLDPGDPGAQGALLGVAVGDGLGVGGRKLGGEQGGAFGAEDAGGEELPDVAICYFLITYSDYTAVVT
jgi:hypothetical protein